MDFRWFLGPLKLILLDSYIDLFLIVKKRLKKKKQFDSVFSMKKMKFNGQFLVGG